MQTVLPEAASCRMRSRIRRTHCRSTPEAGSSRRRTSAPVAMSRARATSFCSPKASDEAISPALSASPTKAREPRAWSRFRRSASAVRRGAKKSGPGARAAARRPGRGGARRGEEERAEALAGLRGQGDQHVVEHRHALEEPDVLETPGQAEPHRPPRRQSGDVLALEGDGPGLGGEEPCEEVEDGGLASAVGSDQGRDLAPWQRQAQLVGRLDAAEALPEPLRDERGAGAVMRRPGWGKDSGYR